MLTMNMKQGFFDRDKVIEAIGRVEAKTMSRALSFVRRTAQRDVLRRRTRTSAPGQPPSVRSTDSVATLRTIWFAYQQREATGVVGPIKLNASVRSSNNASAVPNLLEFGGTVVTRRDQYVPVKAMRRSRVRRKAGKNIKRSTKPYETIPKGTVMRYSPRPFMSVALDKEVKKGTIPGAWAGVVGG